MPTQVTDPALLAQLNGSAVSDPALLAQLNQKSAGDKIMEWLPTTWPARLAKGIYQTATDLPTLPERVLKSAGDLQRTGDQYNPAPVVEAASLASPLSPALSAGERLIPGVAKTLRPGEAVVPTAKELKTASEQGYTSARNADVTYHPEHVTNIASQVRKSLEERGIFEEDAPSTFAKLKRLETVPAPSEGERTVSTFSNLESARKSFGRVAGDYARTNEDRKAATEVIRAIDDFVKMPPSEAVMAGPAAEVGKIAEAARGNHAAAMRSNEITGELDRAFTGVLDKAELRAGSTGSGRNLDNTIRQRAERILSSPKEIRGYTDAEIAQLEQIVKGTGPKNAARIVGNALGGGGGLGAIAAGGFTSGLGVTGGAMAGGPPGAIIGALLGSTVGPTVGFTARQIANTMSKRELAALDEELRKRSPLFLQRQQEAPLVAPSTLPESAIVRALMMSPDYR